MKYEIGKTIINRCTGEKITIISANFGHYRCSVESKDGVFYFAEYERHELERISKEVR